MSFSVPVNLIRQWCYCPRIVYYIELSDYAPSYPVWVRQGEQFHDEQAVLWQRRNFSRFHLEDGRMHQNFRGHSERYNLHGIADMLIETDDAVYPVEFKLDSSVKKKGAILQLTGYALIMEDVFQKSCNLGFLCEGEKLVHKVDITQDLKDETLAKAQAIRDMVGLGAKPDSAASLQQCSHCEYSNYCNDR